MTVTSTSRAPDPIESDSSSSSESDLARRVEQRYPAVMDGAWVGWHQGDEFRQSHASIVNISQHGLLLMALEMPRPTEPGRVFISIETPQPSEWIEARIEGYHREENQTMSLRLRLLRSVPYDLFKAAVYGMISRAESETTPTPEPSGAETAL